MDSARFFPGTCIITRSGIGPFVDTERDTLHGEHQYVSVECVREMAAAIGCLMPEQAAEMIAKQARIEARLAVLEGESDELRRLKNSVKQTLAVGAVRNRDSSFRLRPKPSEKGVDL